MDEKLTIDDLRTLTLDQVNGYLQSKDMERACEACGHAGWELEGVDKSSDRVHVVGHRMVFRENDYLVYVPLTCTNCGNTRFINVSYIYKSTRHPEAADGEK